MNSLARTTGLLAILTATLCGCRPQHGEVHVERHKIVVTTPVVQDVVSTQQYVCQVHSCQHIEVKALESGYLEEIKVKEGQAVNEGDTLFTILPTLYQARLNSDLAEAQQVQIEYNNTVKLFEKKIVSQQEVALVQAKLAKAQAKVDLAKAELNFATVRAPFNGIIDRLYQQKGSLVEEGDMLTTLSDNTVMWVYFNVPEARYLEYMQNLKENQDLKIELKLANGSIFPYPGKIGAIEADFHNQTGNIPFRADFPNPERLLRHGQTGTILISRVVKDAVVIPQRATYEILAKKYAYVVEEVPMHAVPSSDPAHPTEHHVASVDSKGGDHDDDDEEDDDDDHDDDDEEDDDDDKHDDHEIAAEHQHTGPPHSEGSHPGSPSASHPGSPSASHPGSPLPPHPGKPLERHVKHEAVLGGKLGVVRQREIIIANELEDIFVIKEGLAPGDRIVLEGVRQVRDGEEVEYEFQEPGEVLSHLKYHAE